MARIRSIHPGLMADEAFMTLTVETPLAIPLLLGLWMEADDDGIFEWKPLTLKAKSLPAAPVDVNELLSVLCGLNFIRMYEVDGRCYGAVRNFKQWQRPKLPKVKWPKADGIAAYVGDTSPALPQRSPIDREMSEQREEVGEEEEGDTCSLRSQDARAPEFDEFWEVYPNKVGRPAAERAFSKAIKGASFDEIVAGAKSYANKTDDRQWCSPVKWLEEERWNDRPAPPPSKPPPKPNPLSHLSSFQTREEYLRAEKERSERSFKH